MKKVCIFLLFLFSAQFLPAQRSHFIYVQQGAGLSKQWTAGGYAIGWRRICFNVGAGVGNGTDHQFLRADQVNDEKAKQQINTSPTFEPAPYPYGTYLEETNATYNVKQARIGFTVFLRKNDTLDRHPFSGPFAGVELVYLRTDESQTLTYKSPTDETRFSFAATHHFSEIGAVTHVGWQFAFLHDHLYANASFTIPFYYPFIKDPNLNSPFAGTKYEARVGLAWRFGKDADAEQKGTPQGKVREKI